MLSARAFNDANIFRTIVQPLLDNLTLRPDRYRESAIFSLRLSPRSARKLPATKAPAGRRLR
jgi:hypothetical protein